MGMWEKGITIPVKDLKIGAGGLLYGTCPGLVEGSEYVFRVKAVNKGGPSLPSPQSESMIAKIRFSKFFKHKVLSLNGEWRRKTPLRARACGKKERIKCAGVHMIQERAH